jgi:GNAT superfamily N-acetyltransferase
MNIEISTVREVEIIDDKIDKYNNSQVPFLHDKSIELNFCIKDKQDEILAGINALLYGWKILYVGVLFIDEKHRLEGLGSQLLKHVEFEAKKLGAKLVHLDTFSFQARDFYLKHGYEIFGVLDDCPEGHKRYYMKKLI